MMISKSIWVNTMEKLMKIIHNVLKITKVKKKMSKIMKTMKMKIFKMTKALMHFSCNMLLINIKTFWSKNVLIHWKKHKIKRSKILRLWV